MPSRMRMLSLLLSAVLNCVALACLLLWNIAPNIEESEPPAIMATFIAAPQSAQPTPTRERRVVHEASPLAINASIEPISSAVEAEVSAEPGRRSAPVSPVAIEGDLTLQCPQRRAPAYPAQSRRDHEQGTTVVRVEISAQGRVVDAVVVQSSGFERLDAAALAAVRTWRCRPVQRNGQPVRAIALQPFDFILARR